MAVEPIQLDMFPETLQEVKAHNAEYKDDSVEKQLRLLHHRLDKQEAIMEKIVEFLLEDGTDPVPQAWNKVSKLNP